MTALIIGMLVEYRRVFRYPNVMPPIDFSSIPPLAYVFFSLSLLATAVELVFAFIENEIGRKITKCFCVGFLAVMTIVWLPDAWLIYCGAIFGTIGDFLLLKKHKVYPMVFGTLAFLIGHAFYIACYASLVHMEWWLFLGLGVFFVLRRWLQQASQNHQRRPYGLWGHSLLWNAGSGFPLRRFLLLFRRFRLLIPCCFRRGVLHRFRLLPC